MDEFWKKRNKPNAAQLTGALGESVKEYLKKTELPGEKAAVTLNSFYPADAGTLVRTLEEIGGPEKRWSWQGGQAEDKTGYGGPAAQRQGQSGKGGWGQSGEPGFEQKVALVQQALQRDQEAHRRQEGNHYTVGNTAGRGRGSFGGGNLNGESFSGAETGGVLGEAAGGRSRPAFPTTGQGGAGQGAFNFPRTLPQDGRFESGRLNVPERSGVFGQGGAPRLPGWNEAQRVPVTYGPGQQWPQQAPYGMEQQREGERWQPPERSAPHTLPQPWEQREPQPVEPPQGGAATEPSRLALYGPQEQEKMLRLLRKKGLQTLLSGDTLEERNDGGQALLRLARRDVNPYGNLADTSIKLEDAEEEDDDGPFSWLFPKKRMIKDGMRKDLVWDEEKRHFFGDRERMNDKTEEEERNGKTEEEERKDETENEELKESEKNYRDFLELFSQGESLGNYQQAPNESSSWSDKMYGKYQMSNIAMVDLGYEDWNGNWTDKARALGISGWEDFLNNPEAQEQIKYEFDCRSWQYIQNNGLDQYIGRTIDGVLVTSSGLIAAAGLGIGKLETALTTGNMEIADGKGTTIGHYMKEFGKYDVSYITGGE